jgi:hypothetical protein
MNYLNIFHFQYDVILKYYQDLNIIIKQLEQNMFRLNSTNYF